MLKKSFCVFLETGFRANDDSRDKFFSNIVHHIQLWFFLVIRAPDAPSNEGKEFFKYVVIP